MNNIEQIINNELQQMDGLCLDNTEERQTVANRLAGVLINQSLNQLADLLGGSIETDNTGQVVIYTGLNEEGHELKY